MKDIVIIVGMLILGCIIFQFIAGDSNSIRSAGSEVMKDMIKIYEEDPV